RAVDGSLFDSSNTKSTADCTFQRSLSRRTCLPSVSEMVKIEGSPHAWISSSSTIGSECSQPEILRNKFSAANSITERIRSMSPLSSPCDTGERWGEQKSSCTYSKLQYE